MGAMGAMGDAVQGCTGPRSLPGAAPHEVQNRAPGTSAQPQPVQNVAPACGWARATGAPQPTQKAVPGATAAPQDVQNMVHLRVGGQSRAAAAPDPHPAGSRRTAE
jgi:hypothetical protein